MGVGLWFLRQSSQLGTGQIAESRGRMARQVRGSSVMREQWSSGSCMYFQNILGSTERGVFCSIVGGSSGYYCSVTEGKVVFVGPQGLPGDKMKELPAPPEGGTSEVMFWSSELLCFLAGPSSLSFAGAWPLGINAVRPHGSLKICSRMSQHQPRNSKNNNEVLRSYVH